MTLDAAAVSPIFGLVAMPLPLAATRSAGQPPPQLRKGEARLGSKISFPYHLDAVIATSETSH
jgi:hypothetical protein